MLYNFACLIYFLKFMLGISASVSYVRACQKIHMRESTKKKTSCTSNVRKENKAHANVCLKREREWNAIVLS